MGACMVSNLRARTIDLDLPDMSVPSIQVIRQNRNLQHKCMDECFSAQACQESFLCNVLHYSPRIKHYRV
jgi:hypothetical protein